MQCVFCKESIDDDSIFCDQCGEELKRCPTCGNIGKAKVCTKCGTKFTTVTTLGDPQPLPPATPTPPAATHQATIRASDAIQATSTLELHLVNKTLSLDIKIMDASTIGRSSGEYVAIFGSHAQVSGRHCRFDYSPSAGWNVTDLGSTNGTRYDSLPLTVNVPRQLGDQHRLQIANIEFIVKVAGL